LSFAKILVRNWRRLKSPINHREKTITAMDCPRAPHFILLRTPPQWVAR
jgi:hypothetical protein